MRGLRVFVAGFLLSQGAAPGWSGPVLSDVSSSAPAPGGTVVVNVDCANVPGGAADETSVRLYYSTDNQASWHQAAMSRVGEPGYDSTWQGTFTAPSSGLVYYYLRGENGTNYSTQSPLNSSNARPPGSNLLAEAADEPSGDTENNPRGDWLDLTGVAVGRSSDRIYARLTNNYTSWPLNSGILGPWYIYSVGFKNPAAPSDTYAFVLSYANVLGIYTSGLFEIHEITEDYTKIGNIDVDTDGNVLHMRCRLSDLLARPRFGPWPNPQGYLTALSGNTQSADISQNHVQHDTTNFCRFYAARTPCHAVGSNTAPTLESPRVFPPSGTPETEFRFQVRYADPDSNLPVLRAVVVDDDTLRMTPSHHRYWDGPTFTRHQAGFAPGAHVFRFVFDDGMARVTTPPDTFLVSGTATGEPRARQPVTSGGLEVRPNPFHHLVRVRGLAPGMSVTVSDASGRVLCRHRATSRDTEWCWDGTDIGGNCVPPGVFFVSARHDGHLETVRLVRTAR